MSILAALAPKYLWWKPVDGARFTDDRIIAQVMNIGDLADVEAMVDALGHERLRASIARAQPGWFSPRSWTYWHYRLGLTPFDETPGPPPKRVLPT